MDDTDCLVAEETHHALERPVNPRRYFILEPPLFLLYFAWSLSTAVLVDQIVYQACVVSLGVNQTECALLGKEHESPTVRALEAKVQPYSADILMVEALGDSILPAILNLVIGPWSDRYGRKPLLILTFGGTFLYFLFVFGICFLANLYPVNPWVYVVAFIPSVLSGSVATLITTVYCYIADVTSEHERGSKMLLQEVAQYTGTLIGGLSSGVVLRLTNATTVFALATIAGFAALLYIIIFIKESIRIEVNVRETRLSQLRYLLHPGLVLDTFKASFKNRPNYDRAIILMGVMAVGGNIFASEDVHTVFFLFLRNRFNWSVRKFSYYSATDTVFMIVGNVIASLLLQKLFKVSESGIAAIGFFCCCLNSIAIAVASKAWHLYLAVAVCMLKGVADPMTRAFISQVAAPQDNAKIFAFSSTIEALMPLGGGPLYTFVYKRTLSTYPGAFSWFSALVYAVCYCLTIGVCTLQSMRLSRNPHEHY